MIGKIYIITGPSQCGKLSTVLYALKDKPKINVLIINCNIFST
jgi:predicted AAA+ superfamily ATPase